VIRSFVQDGDKTMQSGFENCAVVTAVGGCVELALVVRTISLEFEASEEASEGVAGASSTSSICDRSARNNEDVATAIRLIRAFGVEWYIVDWTRLTTDIFGIFPGFGPRG
jgi:hypothetical protein